MANINAGFFEMSDTNRVLSGVSLGEAKLYLTSKVENFEKSHPGVLITNTSKAYSMINRAKNLRSLAVDVSNFVLAHPSEGLKTL